MGEDSPYLSVVIPCYNELRNLELGALDEVHAYLEGVDFDWEVIVVDDASTDGSLDFVRGWVGGRDGFGVVEIEHGGKPAAVWAGIRESRGGRVLFTDMDQSAPLEEFDRLRPKFDEGYDVVIGSRGGQREGFSPLRRVGSTVFRMLRRSLVLGDIDDTQCGFKACRREVAMDCFPRLQFFEETEQPSGWKVSAFDVELLYLMQRSGYSIAEVEVRWEDRDQSDTKDEVSETWRYVHESRDMLREIVRVKLNELRGYYG